MDFTQESILALKPAGEKVVYRDKTYPNLELRVYKNGTRKFYYRSRNKAYQKDVPLGEHLASVLPIYDALFNIRHLPPNPISEATVVNLFRDNATIHTLKQRFIRDYASVHLTEDTVTTYTKYINRLIVYVEDRKSHLATHICGFEDAQDVIRDFIETVGQYTPTTANRMASCYSKMFNFGIDKRIVSHNPATKIPRNKEKAKHFFANDEQLSQYFDVFNASQCNPRTLDALRLILLTGLRTIEIRSLTRDMIDFSSQRIHMPGELTKNGQPLLVALPRAAFEILKRNCVDLIGTARVFPYGTHALHQACTRMTTRAGLRATPHSLRKIFATQLAMLETRDVVISSALNHMPEGVTKKHYNFYQYETEKRYAGERLAEKYQSLGF